MADLTKCNIDRVNLTNLTVNNYSFRVHDENPYMSTTAKFAYFINSRPVGEVLVDGLEEDKRVQEALASLLKTIEAVYVEKVGIEEHPVLDPRTNELLSGIVNHDTPEEF